MDFGLQKIIMGCTRQIGGVTYGNLCGYQEVIQLWREELLIFKIPKYFTEIIQRCIPYFVPGFAWIPALLYCNLLLCHLIAQPCFVYIECNSSGVTAGIAPFFWYYDVICNARHWLVITVKNIVKEASASVVTFLCVFIFWSLPPKQDDSMLFVLPVTLLLYGCFLFVSCLLFTRDFQIFRDWLSILACIWSFLSFFHIKFLLL